MKAPTLNKKKTFSIGQYSYIFIFVALFAAYFLVAGGLQGKLRWTGITNILRHSAVVGTLSLGMGMIIITGDIDLSVGAILGCTASFGTVLFNLMNLAEIPVAVIIILTVLFCLAFGTLLGFINGALIGKLKLPAFIVTLATSLIYRSVSQYASRILPADIKGATANTYRLMTSPARDAMYGFGNGAVFTLPIPGIIFLVVAAIMIYIATSTKYGKRLYAIGSNAKAAHMAGINVEWNRVSVFTLTGLLCGIGAAVWLCLQGAVDPATCGVSNEMFAIAAVVLGGIAMSGGRGMMLGIIFGALSYTIIDKIIAALNMDSLVNNSIKGAILLVAIVIQVLGPQIKGKKAKK